MFNAFFYGTLMFPEVAGRIANIHHDGEPVTLLGYRRYEAKTRDRGNYPVIVRDESASVDGLLFRDLTTGQREKLDRYEGVEANLYTCQTATVQIDDEQIEVVIYLAGAALYERLREPLARSWSPVLFQQNELQWYVKHQL